MLIAEKKKLDGVEDHLRVTSLPNPLPNICWQYRILNYFRIAWWTEIDMHLNYPKPNTS
jgi:hypothetical protein